MKERKIAHAFCQVLCSESQVTNHSAGFQVWLGFASVRGFHFYVFIVTSTVLREFAECGLNDLQNPCVTEMAQRSCADQIEIQELRWNVTMRRKNEVKNWGEQWGELTKLHKKTHTACLCYWVFISVWSGCRKCCEHLRKKLIRRVFAIRFFVTWMSQIALAWLEKKEFFFVVIVAWTIKADTTEFRSKRPLDTSHCVRY